MLQPFGKNKLLFVVVGTGRCGTVYFAQLLNSIGIPCSHERIFGPLGIDQAIKMIDGEGEDSDVAKHSGLPKRKFVMAESSYMASPYLNYGILSESTIIHAVRNPIDVILSFHNKLQYWHKTNLNKWEKFILSHLPEIKQYDNPLMKNCCFVIRWNQWIEKQSQSRKYIRVRLEYDSEKLLNYFGIPRGLYPKMDKINSHENWKYKLPPLANPITKEDILNSGFGNQIKILADKYNYAL